MHPASRVNIPSVCAIFGGKSEAEVAEYKRALAAEGIEFVSRYAFWAIFRSKQDFRLYTPEEELAVCEVIHRPMLVGAPLS